MNSELLLKVPLLSDLPKTELDYLASTLQVLEVSEGTVLFREDDIGDRFFIVISGEIEVLMRMGSEQEKSLATFVAGEFVGEMSLFEPKGQRTASGRVMKDARLWVLTREDFNALLHRQPMLAYSMVRVLSDRLSTSNIAAFRDLQEKNRQLRDAYLRLKEAQEQIIEKERIERELQVAARIQMSILPDKLPAISNFDFGACISPARAVGGDFYDLLPLGENSVGIVVGDVADKGVPSAIFMARVHALITAEAAPEILPGEVMRRVNYHMTQMKTSDLFVTIFYGVLDCKSGILKYARAGHEIPLILSSTGVERLPHGIGHPVGILDEPSFDEQEFTFPPDSTLLLYTDGMTDCRNPDGIAFGQKRLASLLSSMRKLNAIEVCEALMQNLSHYQVGTPQDDDVTVMAIHSNSVLKNDQTKKVIGNPLD